MLLRRYDEEAVRNGIPSLVLMENAARGAAEVLERDILGARGGLRGKSVHILVGPGNNGGDGLALARHVLGRGGRPFVHVAVDPTSLTGDAGAMLRAWTSFGGSIRMLGPRPSLGDDPSTDDIVVDALFGTGLERNLEGRLRDAAMLVDGHPGLRIALDLPSGLDANTGRVHGFAPHVHHTLTFAAIKPGLLTGAGVVHSGKVHVVDLAVPPSLMGMLGVDGELFEAQDITPMLRRRAVDTHKVREGHTLVLAGSPGKTGAAMLAVRGALRTGAGLCSLHTDPAAIAAMDGHLPELMVEGLPPTMRVGDFDALIHGKHSVVIGPGLGIGGRTGELLEHLFARYAAPIVVDADAITTLSRRPDLCANVPPYAILTPHSGEAARMLDTTAEDVDADRFAALQNLVTLTRCTVLLKGARTLIGSPGRTPQAIDTGSTALAVGGSGDVLAGIIGALSLKLEPFEAARVGATLHGLAADRFTQRTGSDRGLLPTELADSLPSLFGELLAKAH
jgi:NAD(P)H-hydrate epimerase